jgi:hypothetical protein
VLLGISTWVICTLPSYRASAIASSSGDMTKAPCSPLLTSRQLLCTVERTSLYPRISWRRTVDRGESVSSSFRGSGSGICEHGENGELPHACLLALSAMCTGGFWRRDFTGSFCSLLSVSLSLTLSLSLSVCVCVCITHAHTHTQRAHMHAGHSMAYAHITIYVDTQFRGHSAKHCFPQPCRGTWTLD